MNGKRRGTWLLAAGVAALVAVAVYRSGWAQPAPTVAPASAVPASAAPAGAANPPAAGVHPAHGESVSLTLNVSPEDRAAIMAMLDKFITTFSQRDLEGHLSTYHFPHFRFAGSRLVIRQNKDDLASDPLAVARLGGEYDHSQWVSRDIVQASPTKVHLATVFARYRKDGSLIGNYASLYIVDKVDGQWGVRGRSSFAE